MAEILVQAHFFIHSKRLYYLWDYKRTIYETTRDFTWDKWNQYTLLVWNLVQ